MKRAVSLKSARLGHRRGAGWTAAFLLLALAIVAPGVVPGRAQAFEAIDGRFEAHGYFEMQLRTISRNYSGQWDMTQWYNVFNLELELDLVQDTHGILDLLEAYVRIEVRYDCVYTRGCGMFDGVDIYGNEARNLPARLNSGNDYTHAGTIFISEDGPLTDPQRNPYTIKTVPGFRGIYDSTPEGLGGLDYKSLMRCGVPEGTGGDAYCPETTLDYLGGRIGARFWNADRNRRREGTNGTPGEQPAIDDGTAGAPYLIAMEPFADFRFASIPLIGGSNNGFPLLLMGPWLPKNYVETNASLAGLPNPLDESRVSPQSLGAGFGANPMRSIPIFVEDNPGQRQIYILQQTELAGGIVVDQGRWETINPVTGRFGNAREWNDRPAEDYEARGLFVPSPPLRDALANGGFGDYPFNISEMDRAFNRGASQQDEGELKEAYLDIEMFDSRLWLRVGKQSIVWGKTELFRTTDQFNPQDLALSTLPNLEESRIALWSMRGVWSFYEVGPLSDVRLELAVNFDDFESADLGACGEPYAVNLVCALTFGSWAHGVTGVGVAGVDQPPNPWDNADGLEFGARLEWRWDRFSFAITDFYGYDDFPYTVRLSTYNRNVDWESGRPRHYLQTPQQLADRDRYPCASPGGSGVAFMDNPASPGNPNFTEYPIGVAARVTYSGAQEAGCLTPGSTNNNFRWLSQVGAGENGEDVEWGVPQRVDPELRKNIYAPLTNSYYNQAGRWLNDAAYSDANDPRREYSRANSLAPTSFTEWKEGPQAGYCETDPRLAGHAFCDDANAGSRGRRVFDPEKYITVDVGGGDELVPNPRYNPYYDPRFDRHFDASVYASTVPEQFDLQANPGNIMAAPGAPVLFDPFIAASVDGPGGSVPDRYAWWWSNAFDPNLEEFDPRNALDNSPVNNSLFNFICAVTVGFSSLDPSACALTVFSSSKQPSGADSGNPRISTLIGSFLSGSGGFNGFLGSAPSDKILSKGPRLPNGMGMPLVSLHEDMGAADLGLNVDGSPGDSLCSQTFGCGKDAFRTTDVRRHWADMASGTLPGTEDDTYPWIYSRESESYNCLGASPVLNAFGGMHLCGGLEIGDTTPTFPNKLRSAYNVGFFLGRGLTPEQEALMGCGPYFGTSCDANGADLMWAEASAIVQSFIGADSLGISFADLGISHLVSGSLGSHLMDNGSGSVEYRTDSRVIGRNGELLRVDPGALQEVATAFAPWSDDPLGRSVALGSNGFLVEGNPNLFNPVVFSSAPCDLSAGRLLDTAGTFNPSQERASSRCWDLRQYYQAYAIQPGTAAFDVLGLGGPRCTTADIGGPLNPVAGVLPGCRSKWATIQYQPLDTWDGTSSLHPNNPDAGYLGNNWYGQVMSYKAVAFDPSDSNRLNPRTDYRQWSSDPSQHVPGQTALANSVPCGTGTPGTPGDPQNPENYDCYVRNPTDWGLSGLGIGATVRLDSAWGTADPRYAAAQASIRSGLNWGVFAGGAANGPCDPSLYANPRQLREDPNCYLGGWQQTVDGDPDRLGMQILGTNLKYPELVQALGTEAGNPLAALFLYGERVEGGCTPGSSWIYIQRTEDGELLSPAECARVYSNPSETVEGFPWSNALKGGSGHPFTGESFSNELAGVSVNLLMMLVSFSEEFNDGLASVRGFVNPEIYESRYIYDEEWMWNPECDGVVKTAEECGGRLFVQVGFPPGGCQAPCSAYGDPNRDPETLTPGRRVRMVSGWRSMGITNMSILSDRADHIPNALPEGVENKLQRDPSLPHILTMFPDLLMRECTSARTNPDTTLTARELYDECGSVANGRAADWTLNPATANAQNPNGKPWQELRLGDISTLTPHGGLLESLQWDYAFTGSENELMAMLPYCEDLGYSQRSMYQVRGDSFGGSALDSDRFGPNRIDCSRGLAGETLGNERCTYITPQYCGIVQALSGIAGQKRNIVRAGGNSNFGRRTMQWQSGSEIYLAYNRRNVLGFSMDFAEDYTKSNWSMEFTWIEGIPFTDSDSYDLVTEADDFNLTVSVDRPTFINFLNANRTFFINSQWFFQYRKGYKDSFNSIGPWNVLATFAVFTGYFQDRLNPTLVFVWDFRSSSGGLLPQVNYRFSERFSMTVGASVFMGNQRLVNMGVNTIGPASPRSGPNAYMNASEPGLSIVRDRDEVFMTLRYTF